MMQQIWSRIRYTTTGLRAVTKRYGKALGAAEQGRNGSHHQASLHRAELR